MQNAEVSKEFIALIGISKFSSRCKLLEPAIGVEITALMAL